MLGMNRVAEDIGGGDEDRMYAVTSTAVVLKAACSKTLWLGKGVAKISIAVDWGTAVLVGMFAAAKEAFLGATGPSIGAASSPLWLWSSGGGGDGEGHGSEDGSNARDAFAKASFTLTGRATTLRQQRQTMSRMLAALHSPLLATSEKLARDAGLKVGSTSDDEVLGFDPAVLLSIQFGKLLVTGGGGCWRAREVMLRPG